MHHWNPDARFWPPIHAPEQVGGDTVRGPQSWDFVTQIDVMETYTFHSSILFTLSFLLYSLCLF